MTDLQHCKQTHAPFLKARNIVILTKNDYSNKAKAPHVIAKTTDYRHRSGCCRDERVRFRVPMRE